MKEPMCISSSAQILSLPNKGNRNKLFKQLSMGSNSTVRLIIITWKYHLQYYTGCDIEDTRYWDAMAFLNPETVNLLNIAKEELTLIGWDKLLLGMI